MEEFEEQNVDEMIFDKICVIIYSCQNFICILSYRISEGNNIIYSAPNKKVINVCYPCSWGKDGFGYQFSPTPDIQSNGHANGTNDTQRQTSVRRKQNYDGGWVAGKTHQGNYKHR